MRKDAKGANKYMEHVVGSKVENILYFISNLRFLGSMVQKMLGEVEKTQN
jgi:hypothetical protein